MSTALSGAAGRRGAEHARFIERLLDIWRDTLHAPDVCPSSNFFDLGGDSLLALSLFLAIERETGRNFPITTIYDAPTFAEMADLIWDGIRPAFSPLVLLKPGNSGAPLFLVHGIGGTVVELSTLAKHIAIAEPVYAIQARGVDGAEEPLRSVEEMAEFYLDHIRKRQPGGPYMICGYSFGGLVAIEIARRLRSLRQDIALLMLMDAFAHPATWPYLSRVRMHLRRGCYRLAGAARQPWRESLPMLRDEGRRILRKLSGSEADAHARLREWLLDRNPDLPLPLLRVREAGGAALAAYAPTFYPGKVTFLKAASRDPEFPLDPVPIWQRLVGQMDVHTVPGGHRTIVTEHAAAVGAVLTVCIEKIRLPKPSLHPDFSRLPDRRKSPRLETQTIRA